MNDMDTTVAAEETDENTAANTENMEGADAPAAEATEEATEEATAE